MTIEKFINEAKYDSMGQKIWGVDKDGGHQMIADLRGWGAIQNLFKNKNGEIEMKKAEQFQDAMGEWIADAINQKLRQAHVIKSVCGKCGGNSFKAICANTDECRRCGSVKEC